MKSPYEKLDGIVYFPRMLEKIRMHANGELPAEYIPYLGIGFDGRCLKFLKVDYEALKEKVLCGLSDIEIVEWCKKQGFLRTDEEKLIWNEFMTKRGWRDSGPEVNAFREYKEKYGYGNRDDIETYFDFFDIDEGRAKSG